MTTGVGFPTEQHYAPEPGNKRSLLVAGFTLFEHLTSIIPLQNEFIEM